ncbi:MAG: head GIN domain-containing protein [Ferruginibacter sp.]
MKQLLFFAIALFMLASCRQIHGSGNIVKEKRQTGDFSGVSAGGAFEVEVKNGATREVEVEADDNVIGYIETEVRGGVLRINIKENVNFNNAHFKVYVTAPEINSVKSSGASDIKIKETLRSPNKISFDVSGAGSISGIADAPEIDAEISGAGNISMGGRTRNYTAKVSGSGNLKTGDLQTETADIRVSGAGNAWVHASVRLKANASGAGNIHYKGGAQVEQHSSGAGNIISQN